MPVMLNLFTPLFQNLALTVQRKMAENLAIAKAREEAVSLYIYFKLSLNQYSDYFYVT